jgi:hypothetical protein
VAYTVTIVPISDEPGAVTVRVLVEEEGADITPADLNPVTIVNAPDTADAIRVTVADLVALRLGR